MPITKTRLPLDLPVIRQNIRYFLVYSLIPVLIAGFIYLVFRSDNTLIYKISALIVEPTTLSSFKLAMQQLVHPSPWVVYNLPGGLWLFSFACLTRPFFSNQHQTQYALTLLILSLTVVTLEFLQFVNVTDGTFDSIDVLFYGIALLLAVILSIFRIKKSKDFVIYKMDNKNNYWLSAVVGVFIFGIFLADVV